jgi:hypothetical protein
MYWIDWFFMGALGIAALILNVIRGMKRPRSGATNTSGAWVLFLIVLLTALMLAIAAGMLNDLITI